MVLVQKQTSMLLQEVKKAKSCLPKGRHSALTGASTELPARAPTLSGTPASLAFWIQLSFSINLD